MSTLAAPGPSGKWRISDKPGIHSYNLERERRIIAITLATERPPRRLIWPRRILFILGLAGIGFYGYSVAEESIYQSYANWAFNQEIAGHNVTFFDYVRGIAGLETHTVEQSAGLPKQAPKADRPAPGEVVGRVTISRLNMSAVVLEGVDDATLRRSAGHVPSTALPGEAGNFSIAAHRDTLFRPLKDIRLGDEVKFATPQKNMTFRVISTRIVKPTDVSVLAPQGDARLLTMITCYPFYYVGSAPERFIVTALLEVPADAVRGGAVIGAGGSVGAANTPHMQDRSEKGARLAWHHAEHRATNLNQAPEFPRVAGLHRSTASSASASALSPSARAQRVVRRITSFFSRSRLFQAPSSGSEAKL